MRLLFLQPYSPELNLAEHLWEALREDCFANHAFADLDAVERSLTDGLRALEADPSRTQSMTGFKWTTSMRFERNLVSSHRELTHHPRVLVLENVAMEHVGRTFAGAVGEAQQQFGLAVDE